MEYEELQERLREVLPGTSIGLLDGTPYVISARHDEGALRSQTRKIDPEYSGRFAYAPGGAFVYFNNIEWIGDLESRTESKESAA